MIRCITLAACVSILGVSTTAAYGQNKKIILPTKNPVTINKNNGAAKPFNPNALFSNADLLVKLTNDERQKAGLKPLTVSKVLMNVAYGHASNMAAKKEMNHTLDGKTPAQRVADAKYDKSYGGENIAFGYATPEIALAGWMKSAGHKANILNPAFTEIGVGIRTAADGTPYYCQVFGKP